MSTIRVSDNGRFLVYEDGKPFFYLGDTAWSLFHRLNRPDAERYLRNRAAKRFTVIQAVVLGESDGLRVPNPYGHLPLHDLDPTRPNEAYFEHVDFIVSRAAALGLTIGMLPTWGDKWNVKWGQGPEVFTPENARVYGEFLGKRYAGQPILWILGGDRPIENDTHRAITKAMAEGVRAGDGGRNLITFHPTGGRSSAEVLHDEPWLDFNMWQTGHSRNRDSYNCIHSDYVRTPVKPCMDAEPGYEDHSAGFKLENGYLDDYDCRKSLYWALFAGAHGHTYGCHPIWQMWDHERDPYTWVRRTWREALDLPGACQMRHGRSLMLSRPFLERIPDQALIVGDAGESTYHVQATRARDGGYAFVYLPGQKPVEIDLTKLSGEKIVAWWYDPRTGTANRFDTFARSGSRTFTPPPGGPDWILVLDDASRSYGAPGQDAID